MTGAWKGESGESHTDHVEKCSDIDTGDDSKNRCQEIVGGAWKGESGESRTDHVEKCSDIDTGDDSTN